MIPFLGAVTASWGATFAMAAITLGTVFLFGMLKFGVLGFWGNQVPHMDLPWYMSPIKGFIFLIEVMGLLIKHAVLSVRLLANMVAGHLVLLAILGLAVTAVEATHPNWITVAIAIVGSTLFSVLELFVAFLQAYVFTFIGAAIHHH